MASILNADTSNGLKITSDTSGELKIQSAGADIATISSTGIAMAAGKTLPAAALTGTLSALDASSLTNIPAANLTGSLPAGMGGKILQVQSTIKTDDWSGTTGSWQDITGYSVSITPSSTSSKILVTAVVNGSNADMSSFRLVRNSTYIAQNTTATGSRQNGTIGSLAPARDGNKTYNASITYLDSPNTTSATTYKLQTFCHNGAHYINRTNNDPDTNYNVRMVSTITLMEVAG